MKAKTASKPKSSPTPKPVSTVSKTTIFFIGLSALLAAAMIASLQHYWDMESRMTDHLRNSYSKIRDLEEEIKESRMNASSYQPTTPEPIIRALTEKTYNNDTFIAYSLDGGYSEKGQDFIIENEGSAVAVSNFYGEDFTSNMLFDFVGDKMYVVDWVNNSIDVYIMRDETPYYSKSLALPKYKTGSFYGISCENNSCNLRTAFHQEAGCGITFNPRNETFGVPECGGGYSGETYTPEKI